MFSVHTAPEEVKKQQSPVILDLCLRKPRSGKSHDHRDGIVSEKHRFQNVYRPRKNVKPAFSNSSGLMNVFEKLRFRDGLVWTVSGWPNSRNKIAFSNFSRVVWTAP